MMKLLFDFQAAWTIEDKKPAANWPDKGCVEFKDYGVRYREGLDLVLKGITCKIEPTEKVKHILPNYPLNI